MAHDRCQSYQSPPRCSRSIRRKSSDEPHKRGLNTKLYLAVDAHGMPVRILVTQGTDADCGEACRLIEGIKAEYLIADRGYDSDAIVNEATRQGM